MPYLWDVQVLQPIHLFLKELCCCFLQGQCGSTLTTEGWFHYSLRGIFIFCLKRVSLILTYRNDAEIVD